MKVLMLNYEYPPVGGGAANAMYYLLKELSKTDIVVDVITSSPAKYEIEKFSKSITLYKLNIHKKKLHYQSFSDIFWWSSKSLIQILVQRKKYNVCHCLPKELAL